MRFQRHLGGWGAKAIRAMPKCLNAIFNGASLREGLPYRELPKSWHCQEGGGGLTHARIFLVNLTFNIHSVQNSFKMDKIDKIDALFVAKSTSVPGLGGGGGGLSQSWQCQDFGSSGYCNPSLTDKIQQSKFGSFRVLRL